MEVAERPIAAPLPSPETEPFWRAASAGRFILPVCASCAKAHWYPRKICPFCSSDRIEWVVASGAGAIYSYSVMRRAPQPYVIAYVTLREGPTMLTNIVQCDADRIRIGQRVKLRFVPAEDGTPVPMFSPA